VTSADRLFELYAEAFRVGKSDPRPFLDQAGEERDELSEMIELFLVSAGRRSWDPVAFEDSRAKEITDWLVPSLVDPPGGWREVLPGFRHRLGMKREQVVDRLAAKLEAAKNPERDKVAAYYHDMERGNLDPEGVSRPVLESLAEIYETSVEFLGRAGRAATGGEPGGGGVVWARSFGDVDQDFGMASPSTGFSRIEGEPDRIDLLFTDPDHDEPSR
jgi:hypothetical protein